MGSYVSIDTIENPVKPRRKKGMAKKASTKRKSPKAKRSAAARKAAATRKRNKAARSRAAKKGAAKRKRKTRRNPVVVANPRKRTRRNTVVATNPTKRRKKRKPPSRKRRTRRNTVVAPNPTKRRPKKRGGKSRRNPVMALNNFGQALGAMALGFLGYMGMRGILDLTSEVAIRAGLDGKKKQAGGTRVWDAKTGANDLNWHRGLRIVVGLLIIAATFKWAHTRRGSDAASARAVEIKKAVWYGLGVGWFVGTVESIVQMAFERQATATGRAISEIFRSDQRVRPTLLQKIREGVDNSAGYYGNTRTNPVMMPSSRDGIANMQYAAGIVNNDYSAGATGEFVAGNYGGNAGQNYAAEAEEIMASLVDPDVSIGQRHLQPDGVYGMAGVSSDDVAEVRPNDDDFEF